MFDSNDKYTDIGYAKLDMERQKRRGYPETVFCQGKTKEQLFGIFAAFNEKKSNVLGTRASYEQYEYLRDRIVNLKYHDDAGILTIKNNEIIKKGEVAICCAGTSDIKVAEEAAITAEFFGSNAKRYYDIGIAGIHRLFDKIDEIKKAKAIVVVAGMEGALAGIITGMVDVPVIAVPTSVGYGASFNGLSALLTMLNSCAEGMTVVNIDNGFNAGYCANQINLLTEGKNNND